MELDPTLFCYGHEFRAVRYARLDLPTISGDIVLEHVKELLRCGFPVVFGFPVHGSITHAAWIPWPRADDWLRGGQAVVAGSLLLAFLVVLGDLNDHPESGPLVSEASPERWRSVGVDRR